MPNKQTDRPELAEFNALIDSTMRERSCSRDQASSIVVKKYPKLHARVVAEANGNNPVGMQFSRFRDDD